MTSPSESVPDPATERSTEPSNSGTDGGDGAETHGSLSAGLLTAEWHVARTADATFVTVHVTNTHTTAREVRLENRLDGPVLSPCRHGVAEAGWDRDGVTRRIPGETRVSVGYACRAPPETPPVAVHDGPVGESDESPVDRALRSLGDFAPPRAVVSAEQSSEDGSYYEPRPSSEEGPSREPGLSSEPADTPSTEATPDRCDSPPQFSGAVEDVSEDENAPDPPSNETGLAFGAPESRTAPVPATVEAWFRAVEARLTTADRLAGDVHEATPVIASLGGRAGLEALETTLEADAVALAHVAARANELAARADAVDVPTVEGSR